MSEPAHDTPRHARRQFRTFGLIWLAMLLVYWSLAACSGGPPTPPPSGDGPRFVVSSPSDGGTTAGTVLFAVQPFNLAEVARVDFEAGGTDLGFDTNATDGFAVFLIAADFPAGDLTLRATARGHDGRESVQEITVTNVPAPPSSATVGAGGAALGTTEAGGALSTLLIPSDAPEGVDVTFEARSKAEVKAATGVDYDALGVTFLGAQEITTSAPLGTPLGISSGGFGPMVQPDQVVVNYMITDDRDGDGIGELVVINTARVAPNGDVVADPVARILLGAATTTGTTGTRTLRSLQTGAVRGPPGTLIEIEAPAGFNPISPFSNVATFTSEVDGSTIEVLAIFDGAYDQQDPTPTIGAYIPDLPSGPATLFFSNVGTLIASDPIDVDIEPSPALADDAAATIDAVLAAAIAAFSDEPGLERVVTDLSIARNEVAAVAQNPTSGEQEALDGLAAFWQESGVAGLLDPFLAPLVAGARPAQAGCSALELAKGVGANILAGNLTSGGALLSLTPIPFLGSTLYGVGLGTGGYGAKKIFDFYRDCLELLTQPPPVCMVPGTPPSSPPIDTSPPPPEGLRRLQTGPTAGVTGMGSIVPPGGDACGTVTDGGPASGPLSAQQTGLGALLPDLTGRYVIRVFYGAGNSVPFTGVSDAGGYFYLPTVPAGQPFTAIAFDTETQESRSFEGIGPEIGQSTYLAFDFGAEGPSGGTVLAYDTNTDGSHGGTDIYLFDGQAGDVISLAVFSEELRSGNLGFELSDATGAQMASGLATGGHYVEIGPFELETSGLHGFTLDGTELTGGYTLGLAELQPPIAIDPANVVTGELTVLGDRQFYSFDANAGDIVTLTLRHPGSDLHGQLRLLGPDPTRAFFERPQLIRLQTTATVRQRSNNPRELDEAGSYLLEVGLYDPFPADLGAYLGGWEVEVVLEGAP